MHFTTWASIVLDLLDINVQVYFLINLVAPLFFVCLQDAKVMSWWDYGYQITAMANRTILVDNNTWNNTHISRVGQVNCPLLLINFQTVNCCDTHCISRKYPSPCRLVVHV